MVTQMHLFGCVTGGEARRSEETATQGIATRAAQETCSETTIGVVMDGGGGEGLACTAIPNDAVASMRVVSSVEPWKKTEDRKRASKSQLLKLIHDQRFLCATCGITLTPETAEIDHVIPRADGGGNDIGNLQWLCVSCNRAKGTMRHEQFLVLCDRIAKHSAMLRGDHPGAG